ncbi:MAG: tetratricopeptide repeat protein [Myxococcales bacterium]|nr:tetratricopeptide repeat protein [Myxococcales bacterium]
MSVSEKLTRKELKQPDAFQKAGSQVGAWVIERRRTVVAAGVLALLGFGGVALANYLAVRGEERAAQELGGALAAMSLPVEASGQTTAGGKAPYKSELEKDEAVAKALGEFRQKHASGKSSAAAALPLGHALFRLGRHDQALAAFEDFLKGAPAGEPLRATAVEGKGYVLEAKGELDQALAAYDQLSREATGEFMNGMGLYHRARVLILQGKKEEAAKQLSEIPATAPNSAAARLATERMALLAAEGVNVPPPAKPADAGQ